MECFSIFLTLLTDTVLLKCGLVTHLIVYEVVDLLEGSPVQLGREGLVLPRQARAVLHAEAATRHEAELAHELSSARACAPRRFARERRDGGTRPISLGGAHAALVRERDALQRDPQLISARPLGLHVQLITGLGGDQRGCRLWVGGLERAHNLAQQPRAVDLLARRVERRRRREREPPLVLLHPAQATRAPASSPAPTRTHTHYLRTNDVIL